jgi:hypothetical protein
MRPLAILAEYDSLRSTVGAGLHVLPDGQDLHIWHGAVLGRGQGCRYTGGVFRFVVGIPPSYPAGGPGTLRPVVVFLDRPFHPLVDAATGVLCTDVAPAAAVAASVAASAGAPHSLVATLEFVRALVQAGGGVAVPPGPSARAPNPEAARL